ncbi:hypothetical protein BDW02DRAFT_469905, partial [Decorospora gaudefroyi]
SPQPTTTSPPPPPPPLTLQVTFTWSNFQNTIAQLDPKTQTLTPLYTQHFRPTKPQLRFYTTPATTTSSTPETPFATGTINHFSIAGTCTLLNNTNSTPTTIALQPLSRWKTKYNYLSPALGDVPVSWTTSSSIKTWDFVCVNSETQSALARFSVNVWGLKEIGRFVFLEDGGAVSEALRDEVVVTGLTVLYVMAARMNSLGLFFGAFFAKTGRVEGD